MAFENSICMHMMLDLVDGAYICCDGHFGFDIRKFHVLQSERSQVQGEMNGKRESVMIFGMRLCLGWCCIDGTPLRR